MEETTNSQSVAPTTAGGIKHRNPALVVIFSLITFGIYTIYWLVSTTLELNKKTQSAPNPWILLAMLIPIVGIVVSIWYVWRYCKAVNEFTGYSNVTLFILWILGSFTLGITGMIALVLIQQQLNSKA